MAVTEGEKKLLATALILTIAGQACHQAVPVIGSTPGPDTGTSEQVPDSEVDTSFTGSVVWAVDQEILDSVAQGMNLPTSEVSGFTISLDRQSVGLSDYHVPVGISQGPDIDSRSQPIVRDFIFKDGDPNQPIPLQYRESFDNNGANWMRESLSTETGAKQTVFEYPANGNDLLEKGEGFDMLYYPTTEVRDQLIGVGDKPIRIRVNPISSNQQVVAPTPFSGAELVDYQVPQLEEIPQTEPSPTLPPPPPTPEPPTATPEASYNQVSSPDNTQGMSLLTLADTKGDFAKWVHNTCSDTISMNPKNIDFVVNNIPSSGTNFLSSNIATNSYETGYNQARNVYFCKDHIARINPSQFGLDNKSDIFTVPYLYMDTTGKRVVFQFAIGKNGLVMMQNLGFFSDRNGPRLQPTDKLPNDLSDIYLYGEVNSADDSRSLAKTLYESQGIKQEKILQLFERIAETGIINEEDQIFIESTVFIPSLGTGPSANE